MPSRTHEQRQRDSQHEVVRYLLVEGRGDPEKDSKGGQPPQSGSTMETKMKEYCGQLHFKGTGLQRTFLGQNTEPGNVSSCVILSMMSTAVPA